MTLINLNRCCIFSLMWNTKDDILRNVFLLFIFCVSQKKEYAENQTKIQYTEMQHYSEI